MTASKCLKYIQELCWMLCQYGTLDTNPQLWLKCFADYKGNIAFRFHATLWGCFAAHAVWSSGVSTCKNMSISVITLQHQITLTVQQFTICKISNITNVNNSPHQGAGTSSAKALFWCVDWPMGVSPPGLKALTWASVGPNLVSAQAFRSFFGTSFRNLRDPNLRRLGSAWDLISQRWNFRLHCVYTPGPRLQKGESLHFYHLFQPETLLGVNPELPWFCNNLRLQLQHTLPEAFTSKTLNSPVQALAKAFVSGAQATNQSKHPQ